jgi:hypothetical protein
MVLEKTQSNVAPETVADKLRPWVRPELKSLNAGSAEASDGTVDDLNFNNS